MTTAPSPAANRRTWIGLAVLLLPVLLIAMDMSVLFFAIPFIAEDLHPSSAEQLWILDVYGFVLAGMLLTMGALGDRIGRRRLLMLGATAFGAASTLAAFAPSTAVLILARGLLGLAGATLMPSTLGLIRNMFRDDAQRRTAIAIWSAAMSGGAALGPIIGGALLQHFAWGAVFLINVPVMAVLLALAPRLLPEDRATTAGRVDLPSALLSLGTVLPLVWGIKRAAEHGIDEAALSAVIAGLAVGAGFVHRQRVQEHPLVDLSLFRRRAFSGALLVNVLGIFTIVGFSLFSTQYLQAVLGLRPLDAALWTLPAPLSIGVAAAVTLALARRVRPAVVIAAGAVATALGLAVLLRAEPDSSVTVVVAGSTLMAFGIGVMMTLVTDMVVAAAPAERAGATAALSETGNELGGALGIAILGSVGAAAYRRAMPTEPAAGAPAAAWRAAHETLGGAVSAAAGLPGRSGDLVLDAARAAFVAGMHAAAWAAIGAMLLAAAASLVLLRDVPRHVTGVDHAAPPARSPPAGATTSVRDA